MSALIVQHATRRVVLCGNPNTGKTTVFNALTGFRAHTGNYAGVTVERKSGPLRGSTSQHPVEIIDLPGAYSLAARSADEMVAVEVLLGFREDEPRPDLALIVVDASNLERNLFLATQVIESGVPCAIVLNMMDAAHANSIVIDQKLLSQRLGVPVFPAVASRGEGFDTIRQFLTDPNGAPPPPPVVVPFPAAFESAAESARKAILDAGARAEDTPPLLIRRALLESRGMAEELLAKRCGESARHALTTARVTLHDAGVKLPALEAHVRYDFIRNLLDGAAQRPQSRRETHSDRIDRILIHKVWGTAIFALLMLLVFQAIYSWSAPFMDMIDGTFGWLGGLIEASMPAGPLQSFLVNGVISGVGGVIVFLPQILFLFLFISLLEDCGYMARAAFLMDRLLNGCGLSGRSFIPMLSSFACAIPGIMATRTIEDRRDRFTTILIAPLMSCSARLPVYTLLIGAFIPSRRLFGVVNVQGLTLFAMYCVGFVVAIPVALILKKTFFRGATPALLLELPPYRRPSLKTVFWRLVDRAGAFLKRAGTIIFAVSVLIWAATYYPHPESIRSETEARFQTELSSAVNDDEKATIQDEVDKAVSGAYLRQSFLGRAGIAIEPFVEPLGWDWKIAIAALASFPAREVIVSTLGIIYDLGADTDEQSTDLRDKLRAATRENGQPVFTIPVALSIMVFFALCAQCAATLAVMRRETNSWRWPAFAFAYMTTLAYLGALLTFQVGTALMH
ncbi:ferrous iron transport protein B [Candidatus Sumerlaeota bacterium]|nr:ferrous iron transport protein B [Candidatus Sumerlaeota bacterium]